VSNAPGVIAAVIALLVLGAAGVAAFAAFSVESDSGEVMVVEQAGDPAVTGAGAGASGAGTGGADAPAAAAADLLRGSLQPALDPLQAELGPTFRVKGITVYPGYAIFQVEPPELPGELDRWTVHLPDRVNGPDPVSNPGDVEADLFALAELDLAVLAGLPARAEELLADDIPGGEAGYLVIGRSRSDGEVVAIDVYVSTERRNGYVSFTTTGEVLRQYGG
jgi:hypothetical protein